MAESFTLISLYSELYQKWQRAFLSFSFCDEMYQKWPTAFLSFSLRDKMAKSFSIFLNLWLVFKMTEIFDLFWQG
jgi:hypothetical protein